MHKIYVDITAFSYMQLHSAFHRHISAYICQLYGIYGDSLKLLKYNIEKAKYEVIGTKPFVDWQKRNLSGIEFEKSMKSAVPLDNRAMSGEIFLDLDAGWMIHPPRSVLYRSLKINGARIATFVHEMLPLTYPQYAREDEVIHFIPYIGAVLRYADCFLSYNQAILDEVYALAARLKSGCPWGYVCPPNMELIPARPGDEPNAQVVRSLAGRKFILSVDSLAPYNDYRLLLDAFDDRLYDSGLCLVMAGDNAFEDEEMQMRLSLTPQFGKQLFCIENADAATMHWLYGNAYMLAYTARVDAFCWPVLESLHNGLPVISSDLPSVRQMCRDRCIYFEANDVRMFADFVLKFCEDEKAYNVLKRRIADRQCLEYGTSLASIINIMLDE